MLTIHFANRFETLADLLAEQLGADRPTCTAALFAADELIVPSAAVQRQLTLNLTRRHGVCANLRFSYLAQWLWQQVGRVLTTAAAGPGRGSAGALAIGNSPFQPALLAWSIYAALADARWTADHPRLARYLAQADAVTRFELAKRVAALLDQYITYRPDWLAAWAAGTSALSGNGLAAHTAADEAWQAALWRRLLAQAPGLAEAGEAGVELAHTLGHELSDTLARLGPTPPVGAGLPAQAHVFCLPTVAPVYLGLLQQLGRWMDLRLYALNPCQEYWFEVIDQRRLAHLAVRGQAQHHEEGHRLLAAWGQQAQAQLAGLIDACGDAVVDEGRFTPHPDYTLLARLHNSILNLQDLAPRSVPLAADDRSIEVHVCHSLTRELEVLHNRLLALLAAPDAPQPGEILVVTPDLGTAAPLIESVFGTAPRDCAIPFTITGRAASQVNAPARALLALLALAGSRCTASAVFGLLQQALVARRFGFDEDDLARVHRWLQDAGIHWALNGEHRASLGLPATSRHSFDDGLDRLFMGYALPSQATLPLDGRLPVGNAEGGDAVALGALWRFVDALTTLHAQLATPLPPSRWSELLAGLIDAFLLPDASELDDAAELRQALQALADQWQRSALTEPLPLDVVRQALSQWLDDPARGGVPTGRVTFSAMSSLRSLPYRVVCLLGLNDGDFPAAARTAEFDLMAAQPRRGDRQRGSDERNLFLDLLLAARDRLHLSYTGRSVRDNAPLPPSVLVAELLDYLLPALDATPDAARSHLVVEHPLQGFAQALFEPATDPRLRSFNREYAQALAASRPAPATPMPTDEGAAAAAVAADADEDEDTADDTDGQDGTPPFFTQPLAEPEPEWQTLTLERLQRFFRNPSRFLLQQRLGLTLGRPEQALIDDEPFLPDGWVRDALARRLLPALLCGADDAALIALAEAGTELPAGALGRRFVAGELPSLRAYAADLAALSAPPLQPPHLATLTFDVDGQRWHLQVGFAELRADGAVQQRYADARCTDYLDAWLAHLALCACAPAGVAGRTVWLGRDGRFSFRPCDDAQASLQTLLGLYAQGLRSPLYFFPKSAWAWLRPGGSRAKAATAWRVSPRQPYAEQADSAYRLALRGLPDPLAEGAARFEAIARTVLTPLLQHLDDPRTP